MKSITHDRELSTVDTPAPESLINPWDYRFEKIYIWLCEREEVTPAAKLVYVRLSGLSRKYGYAFPTIETLAKRTGLSARSVARCLRELRGHGLIHVQRRGLGRSNHYWFLKHPWAHLPVTGPETAVLPEEDDYEED